MPEDSFIEDSFIPEENNQTFGDFIKNYLNTAPQRAEKRISSRTSAIKRWEERSKDPNLFFQHPLGTYLTGLGAGFEIAESVPASAILSLAPEGKFQPNLQRTISDVSKTLKGKRPAQVGDILTAMGLPEPAAATGGLLLTALKRTPTAAFGEAAMSPFTNAFRYIKKLALEKGMPFITKTVKFMSGIPESHTEFAVNNPELLHKPILSKLAQEAEDGMENFVVPLEDNTVIKVDLKPTHEALKKLRMLTKTGELTAQTAKLSPKEQEFIKNVLTELQGYTGENQPTFARVRYLLGRMDDILSPTYKQRYKGIEPVTNTFQDITKFIRGALRSSINENNFPEADKALTAYAHSEMAKNVYKTFTGMNPSFFKSLPLRLTAVAALGLKSPVAGLLALPFTMPLTYKGLIGGVDIGQKIISEPTVSFEFLKRFGLESEEKEKNGEDSFQAD